MKMRCVGVAMILALGGALLLGRWNRMAMAATTDNPRAGYDTRTTTPEYDSTTKYSGSDVLTLIDTSRMTPDQINERTNGNKAQLDLDNYKVDLRVDKDKTVHVRQQIRVTYYGARGGYSNIQFFVPMKQTFKKIGSDKTVTVYNTISNVKVEGLHRGTTEDRWANNKYTDGEPYYFVERSRGVKGDSDQYTIQVGYDMRYIMNGYRTYTVTYDYRPTMLTDRNVLFYDFDTVDFNGGMSAVRDMNFTLTMPDEIEPNQLQFSAIASFNGSVNESPTDVAEASKHLIQYSINSNTVTGEFHGRIIGDMGERDTLGTSAPYLQLTTPVGYFSNGVTASSVAGNLIGSLTGYWMLGAAAGCLICLAITYWLWRKYGRGRVATDKTQTEPPDGVNSFAAGAIWSGIYDRRGALSLLPYLASYGYIGIKSEPGTGGNEYTIIRAKTYDGANKYEALLLDSLFNTDFDKLMAEAEKIGDADTLRLLRERRAAMKDAFQISSLNRDRGKDLLMVTIDGQNRDSQLLSFILKYIADTANVDEARLVKAGHLMRRFSLINCLVCALTLILLGVAYLMLAQVHGVLPNNDPVSKLSIFAYAILPVWLYVLVARRLRWLNKIGFVIGYGLALAITVFVRAAPQIILSGDTEVNIYSAIITLILVCSTAAIMQIVAIYLGKRDARMADWIGAVRSYRHYLKRVEKPRIKADDNVNPGNDHEQLAYMYALRVSNTWVRRLEVLV